MRIKKGFTLAEILIVLMVIGVIAMLTIPSMMKGVTEAQLKAGYKKAYNTIVNLAAMERISGGLPSRPNSTQAADFFIALSNNLSVKYYVAPGVSAPGSGTKIVGSQSVTALNIQRAENSTMTVGSGTPSETAATIGNDAASPWVVTDDGIAYGMVLPSGAAANTDCRTKADINAAASAEAAAAASCVIVIADIAYL